jgi:lipoprotein-releasing system permease protein
VLALIVILAVMNGFQLGFIESILEISSYHLRLENFPVEKTEELRETLLDIPGVTTAVPFREFQGIARGSRQGQHGVLVRGVRPDTDRLDPAMGNHMVFEEGYFVLSDPQSVLLGVELARRLSVKTGDVISLFSISGILSGDEDMTGVRTLTVTGIFRTGYYEYDTSWAFINIESAAAFLDGGGLVLGMKLKNRFQDRHAMDLAERALRDKGLPQARFSIWRDYNSSFFGALRTEKLFMFIMVGLIFIIVGLNIFQAQRRVVLERREEIGLLRAVGGSLRAVRFIFICDGAIIGFTGAGAGLVLGLLVASDIQGFFTVIETIVNAVLSAFNYIAGFFGTAGSGQFAIFSPAVFYIKEIPYRIIAGEVVLIYMFGFLSAVLAAWLASIGISKIQPAEVLRYE